MAVAALVESSALDRRPASIEQESAPGIEDDRPDAERRHVVVNLAAAGQDANGPREQGAPQVVPSRISRRCGMRSNAKLAYP